METDLSALSLKELKALIARAGLSSEDCIDKADLRSRAREAQEVLTRAPAPAPTPSGPFQTVKTFGGYQCGVRAPSDVLNGAMADLLVVVLHGLGATNTDLVPLSDLILQQAPEVATRRIVWIFPQAPSTPIGTAWWTLDLASFMAVSMNPGNDQLLSKLIRDEPTGLAQCRSRMATLLADAKAFAGGLPSSKVLFCGFSLGAITSLDIALQQPAGESLGGVVMMNGAPIVVEQWAERLKLHPKLRVHMSAGLQDMVLPAKASDWALQLLQANGADATLMKHPGGHDVGGTEVLKSVAKFIAATLVR
ncbi:hypothetical protein AB1Y20_017466 [Prymnesium parvum]|uniref:Phospholipase/carboxylesterase/thioesterase domain-containing protein n=1 Tax=Prymnesium parvum TaxID=97485 RepID=A0AB34JNE7_PRYPA|mmetsp:Transcript_6962/g.17407  ORF Transcript_6962/g.17407 Transcript_6962/m.17407 type:complete len:307 (-) Transcript_6962:417-1337(-)